MSSVTDAFLGISQKISEQLSKSNHFHAVGTLKEMNGLLKDLIRSALSLVIHNICKFKALAPPEVFDLVF